MKHGMLGVLSLSTALASIAPSKALGDLPRTASVASSASPELVRAANARCKLHRPTDRAHLTLTWHGACRDGLAEGSGVVRYTQGREVESVFYGTLKRGHLELGVLEVSGGFMAGRFAHGALVDTDDRRLIEEAFRQAARAARELARTFKKQGNGGSAAHYEAKASLLDQQMD